MGSRFFLLLLLRCALLSAKEVCFFVPPKGWEIADPAKNAPRVQIAFVEKRAEGFPASVNLAIERTAISLEAYVEAVRKIYSADPNAQWRDLGTFKTEMGVGRLTEVERPAELGKARMVQLIVVKDQFAYTLTACSLKKEFSKYYKIFDRTLRSLQSTSDLIKSYPAKDRIALESAVHAVKSGKDWKVFEQKIINDFTEMGPYWQILILEELHLTQGK